MNIMRSRVLKFLKWFYFISSHPTIYLFALTALRIQFLAIEIARNREGCNAKVREQAKAAASAAASAAAGAQ
jgi:hypothetical protein